MDRLGDVSARPRGLFTYGAFFTCSAIWGSTFLFISLGNDAKLPPVWAATLRLAIATAILALIVLITRQKFPTGLALRAAALYGILEFGVNFPLLYWAEKSVPSGLTAVLYATIPLTTGLVAWRLKLERLSKAKVLGAAVGLAGVVVIFSGQIGGKLTALPLLALVVSSTCAGLATLPLKMGPPQSPIAANAVGALFGTVICAAVSLFAGEHQVLPHGFAQWGPLLYLAVMGSVVAFGSMAWLLNHWQVSSVSFVSVIVPVIAVVLGVIVHGEHFSLLTLAGALLVIAGVFMAVSSDRKAAAASVMVEHG